MNNLKAILCCVFVVWSIEVRDAIATTTSGLSYSEYDPNPEFPYGRQNPEAPVGTESYSFMIGSWTCQDNRRANGEWTSFNSIMTARYFLNGLGIINFTNTPTSHSSMTYEFQQEEQNWLITNFSAGNTQHTTWIGNRVGSEMVAQLLRSADSSETPILEIAFDQITKDAFHWRFEAKTAEGSYLIQEKHCSREKN